MGSKFTVSRVAASKKLAATSVCVSMIGVIVKFTAELLEGRLVKRYKRFLADVLYQGAELTLHCPNTGKMTGCAEPGWRVYFSIADNPKRKYPHTWELVENAQGELICVNTQRANQLVAQALADKKIDTLAGYQQIIPEARYGQENSRIDFLLRQAGLPDCYLEVKSVTLCSEHTSGLGYFPDTQSLRAQKHVRELIDCVQQGHRAVLLFCVLHTGIHYVRPAAHLDAEYAALVTQAHALGVECIAWRAKISPHGMQLVEELEFQLSEAVNP